MAMPCAICSHFAANGESEVTRYVDAAGVTHAIPTAWLAQQRGDEAMWATACAMQLALASIDELTAVIGDGDDPEGVNMPGSVCDRSRRWLRELRGGGAGEASREREDEQVTANSVLGRRFNERHAAGVTRYQVDRPHVNPGYYECVAIRAVEGTHHFIGCIQVFSLTHINAALAGEVQ